jgi:small subunit ribosomal protein S18
MARNNDRDRDRGTKRVLKDTRPRGKKKVCIFCKEHATWVDYKDINLMRRYMSDRGKIRSRRVTGNCAQHQRGIALAIKTARELVLLPYTQRTVTERPGGRRGGRDGRDGRDGRGPGDRRGPRAETEEPATDVQNADTTGPDGAPESMPVSESVAEPVVDEGDAGDSTPEPVEES